jgi:hypothetical protein
MTTYITHINELEKLAKGELKVSDIAIPENIAILTWSGADIKNWLENKRQTTVEIDEGIVNDIADRLEGSGCGDCITSALYDYTEEVLKEVEGEKVGLPKM